MRLQFEDVARLPLPADNVAIATRSLDAGTVIVLGDQQFELSHTVLVGHRFAVHDIPAGQPLLSWGQTFGLTTKPIRAGEYVANQAVLTELRRRSQSFTLPDSANFDDDLERFTFDEQTFVPAPPLPRYADPLTFMGYQRGGDRGVGTRNMIILLGTTALVSGFVRRLEHDLQPHLADFPNIDGIVAIAHTEGAHEKPNNADLLVRTLAGFVVHPNVAAVLIVDHGSEVVNNTTLRDYLQREKYPLSAVTHHFMSLSTSFEDDLARGAALVRQWLEPVNALQRTPQPMRALKIALQCGGSDAFSGVSGNPLVAWVAKAVIQHGGSANLAETDELIGAERYVLDKVRDAATVKKFLSFVERFKTYVGWHGHSAEGNPSGGNKFRGLYNIYLKSLGAATKRDPDVRLDYVIDYGERMDLPGYYFMDSPGNDLESIAGQVAAGCNLIFFVTGNGSITNFPFVPTIKIVTTTERYTLLADDMDINAGAYLDGKPLPEVGADTFDYTRAVASGQRSVGEQAGHSQVQIWRDWQFNQPTALDPLKNMTFTGDPIPINTAVTVPERSIDMLRDGDVITMERVGLILPTSLCSGQIAGLCIRALNKHPQLRASDVSRFVTLVHTEGCGGSVNLEFRDTMLGYLEHPFVKHALLLEHGCEATHNDYFRNALVERGIVPDDYGWASIQLDGGIQSVIAKMVAWFTAQMTDEQRHQPVTTDLSAVQLALATHGALAPSVVAAYAQLTQIIVAAGGTVVIHEQDALLQTDFAAQIGVGSPAVASLGYGQVASGAGFYIMAMPTRNWGEVLTGLGAAGVQIILSHIDDKALPGHPMIPVLQVSQAAQTDADITLSPASPTVDPLLDVIVETLSRRYVPKSSQLGHTNFQITRGLLGVSL